MKKIIKLTSQAGSKAAYFNPKCIFYFSEIESTVNVSSDRWFIEVKESWNEVRKLAEELGFLEFARVDITKRVFVNANMVSEWHEQDGGVFLEFGVGGYVVDGTLEEVTAKIEKALDGGVCDDGKEDHNHA